jgi:hypothetical protein
MDMDAVTGPVQIVDPEIAEAPKPRTGKTPFTLREKTPWTARPPIMMVASAGLGALMAAIVVLVWAVVAGPQSGQPQADSKASPAQPAPSNPSDVPLSAPDASALPGGLPAGLPGIPSGAATGGTGGANPLAAFTPRPSVLSGGGGGGSAPALPAFPPPPDLQTTLDALSPYAGPALAQSVTGDAIVSLISNVGGWATAAAVATANNGTSLVNNLILASALSGGNPLGFLGQVSAGAVGLANIPGQMLNAAANPVAALGGLASAMAVSMPALDALSRLPSIQLPPIGLPQPPPIGLPPIGLPPPPPIGLPAPPSPLMLAALGL